MLHVETAPRSDISKGNETNSPGSAEQQHERGEEEERAASSSSSSSSGSDAEEGESQGSGKSQKQSFTAADFSAYTPISEINISRSGNNALYAALPQLEKPEEVGGERLAFAF